MKIRNQSSIRQTLKAGFSLAELMVVIVILGLLATVVVPNVWSKFMKSQRQIAKTNINSLATALKEYRIDNRAWPETLDALVEPDENGHRYLEMTAIPKDPWNNEFFYEAPRTGGDPIIISYGDDGQPGGDGDARDITYADMLNGDA